MTDDDKREFWALLKGVHDFYRVDASEFAARVWWQACSRYSLEQVTKAFDAHLLDPKSGQFMPKPADLVKQLQGTHEDRALVAWGKFLDALQRVGHYQTVAFDDATIHAVVVDLGGWTKVGGITYDELPFLQKRFCDLYRAYSAHGNPRTYPAMLAGECRISNNALGFKDDDCVLVGDPDKARAVLAGGSTTGKTQFLQLGKMPTPALLEDKGAR